MKKISKLVKEYKNEIKKDYDSTVRIVSLIPNISEEDYNDLYISAILRMCIKYETFTSLAISEYVDRNNVEFNHPWRYTRQLVDILGINVDGQYDVAHDMWVIYNTLKHVNSQTEHNFLNMIRKYNLSDIKDIANFIKKALMKLLEAIERG